MYIPSQYHVARIHQRQTTPCLTTWWHLYKQRLSLHFNTAILYYRLFYISNASESFSNGLCSLWGCEGDRGRQISTLLGVIRVSLGCSLSHFHLCLLMCGRLMGRGRDRETEGEQMRCKNPKACCSLIIQHSFNLTVYFTVILLQTSLQIVLCCFCTSAYTVIFTCTIYTFVKLTHVSRHTPVCTLLAPAPLLIWRHVLDVSIFLHLFFHK